MCPIYEYEYIISKYCDIDAHLIKYQNPCKCNHKKIIVTGHSESNYHPPKVKMFHEILLHAIKTDLSNIRSFDKVVSKIVPF